VQVIVVGEDVLDWAGGLVVVVVFFAVVVVDEDVVEDLSEFLESDFDFGLEVVAVVPLVDVDGGSGSCGAVTVVDGGEAAADAVGSIRVPAVAPGRGSELAGDAWAGDDVASAEGRAEAASGGDGGGTAVSGAAVTGSATSPSGASGTDRAAWRARRTSGWDRGDTRLVEKRDETSCTPKSPRSTPLAVPRAHVTTRTRFTFQCSAVGPHEHAKTRLNQRQDSRLGGRCGVASVALIEDDQRIRAALVRSLAERGHTVRAAGRAMEGLTQVLEWHPDVVVLDLGLPDLDGTELLKMIRAVSAVPVIVATARDDEAEMVRMLDRGADDYVTKPFSADQLDARIRAVLRRAQGAGPGGRAVSAQLTFADVQLDDDTHEVWKAGEEVALSPTEFKLLRYLMQNAGRVLSKTQILDHVWKYDFGGDASIVESYVSYLRKKVDTTEPRLIHTLRGVGYTMRLPRTGP
jgi:two-component system OmpR family response regulator